MAPRKPDFFNSRSHHDGPLHLVYPESTYPALAVCYAYKLLALQCSVDLQPPEGYDPDGATNLVDSATITVVLGCWSEPW